MLPSFICPEYWTLPQTHWVLSSLGDRNYSKQVTNWLSLWICILPDQMFPHFIFQYSLQQWICICLKKPTNGIDPEHQPYQSGIFSLEIQYLPICSSVVSSSQTSFFLSKSIHSTRKHLWCHQVLKPDQFLGLWLPLETTNSHCMQHKKTLSTYIYIFEYFQFAANLIMGIC